MSDASLSFTEGPLFRRLLAFALPLMAVNLLQYVYQAVDMVVVGQVVGPVGLVSISNATNAAYIVNAFVIGLTAGGGVVVARFVGARDVAGQRRAYAATLAVALAGSAAIAVLDVMEREKLVENAADTGEYLLGELRKADGPKEIRGRGLMIGIEIDGSGAEFRKKLLFGKHVFTGGAGASTVRLLPALCLTRELADRFLDAFDATLRGK